jgi:hypothetical protein
MFYKLGSLMRSRSRLARTGVRGSSPDIPNTALDTEITGERPDEGIGPYNHANPGSLARSRSRIARTRVRGSSPGIPNTALDNEITGERPDEGIGPCKHAGSEA